MMVEEVKLRRKYLNEGDVFILDLGLQLIQVTWAKWDFPCALEYFLM